MFHGKRLVQTAVRSGSGRPGRMRRRGQANQIRMRPRSVWEATALRISGVDAPAGDGNDAAR
jgi:hypothetical protein